MERRKISWVRLFSRHFIWVPAVPLAIALVLVLFARNQFDTAGRLALHGTEGVAVVTEREIRTTRDREGRTSTEYRLHYRFQPLSGPEITARRTVRRTTYEAVQTGSEIAVQYIAHDPAVHEIEPGAAHRTGMVLSLIALPLGLTGLGLALWTGRRKLSLFRAARHGEVRQARVTGHEPTNTKINGRPQYRLLWQDAAGKDGRSSMRRLDALPAPGSVIVVYIDPVTQRGWWEAEL